MLGIKNQNFPRRRCTARDLGIVRFRTSTSNPDDGNRYRFGKREQLARWRAGWVQLAARTMGLRLATDISGMHLNSADLRAVMKGILRDHLRADERAWRRIVRP